MNTCWIDDRGWRVLLTAIFALLVSAAAGCGLAVNLIHAGLGSLRPPRYTGLEGRRVAVVCVSQSSSFGPTAAADQIAARVARQLRVRVPEIQIVDPQKIEEWRDLHDWNEIDYQELAEGVNAERLVAMELESFSLYEGKTLFKGRADVRLSVYDFNASEEPVYQEGTWQEAFPINGGQHTADTSEDDFRRRFVDVVATRVARRFYAYDPVEDYARDPTFVGGD